MENLSSYPPSSTPPNVLNLPMLYYGIAVVGTAAVVLVLYNIILINLCTYRSTAARAAMMPTLVEVSGRGGGRNVTRQLRLPSLKYKTRDRSEETECAVCLSVVEDGEEVRELSRCKHVFHCACIDMWLYSHRDCPLCRTSVSPRVQENVDTVCGSREGLPEFAVV